MKVLIVSQPNMLTEKDYSVLYPYSEVDYEELDHISTSELAFKAREYDCLMLNYDVAEPFQEEFYSLVEGSKLKFISCDITGMSWAFPQTAFKKNIILTNTPNYCTRSVAEQIIGQMFLHSRKIHAAYCDLINGNEPKVRKGFNLEGKTVGVLGLGHIGQQAAKIASGMGMNVIAWNHKHKDVDIPLLPIDEVFRSSDIICICVKTTDDTKGMINADLLRLCKSNCIVINQAGEQIVNIDDIYNSLLNQQISGYSGTYSHDISSHPILKLETAIFQPANAWFSDESLAELRRIWVNNVVEYINGKIINQVLS